MTPCDVKIEPRGGTLHARSRTGCHKPECRCTLATWYHARLRRHLDIPGLFNRTAAVPKTTDIIARALKEAGVTHAFGIPGGEVLDLLEAFRAADIEFVLTKQELGAGMMADAVFQLTGKPGVLVATLGPGITNTTTTVAQAL